MPRHRRELQGRLSRRASPAGVLPCSVILRPPQICVAVQSSFIEKGSVESTHKVTFNMTHASERGAAARKSQRVTRIAGVEKFVGSRFTLACNTSYRTSWAAGEPGRATTEPIGIDDKTHDTYSQTLRLRTDTAAITVSMHTNSGAPVLQSTPGPQNDLRPGESSLSRGWRRAHKRQQCSCHGPRTPTRLSSRRSSDPRPAHQPPSAPPTPGEREPPLSIVNDSPPHHSERPVMHCCHGRPAEFAPAVMALVRPE